jgi:hypothetical protein
VSFNPGLRNIAALLVWVGLFVPTHALSCAADKVIGPSSQAFCRGRCLDLPFESVHGLIVLSLELDGHPSEHFILDSGASASVVDESTARQLGIPMTFSTGLSLKSRTEVRQGLAVAHSVQIRYRRWILITGSTPVLDLSGMSNALGLHISGLIGFDYMRVHPLMIDYTASTLRIPLDRRIDSSKFPGIGLETHGAAPTVSGELALSDGRHLSGNFLLDTGADSGLEWNRAFIKRNSLAFTDESGEKTSLTSTGDLYTQKLLVASGLRLGNVQFSNVPVRLATNVETGILSGDTVDGEIGNAILKQCGTVVFDAPHARVFLGASR